MLALPQAAKDALGQELIAAASAGSAKRVAAALERGADVNHQDKTGRTALHRAAETGCQAVAKQLLGRGADPNSEDSDGCSPLDRAVVYGYEELTELLVDAGAQGSSPWTGRLDIDTSFRLMQFSNPFMLVINTAALWYFASQGWWMPASLYAGVVVFVVLNELL